MHKSIKAGFLQSTGFKESDNVAAECAAHVSAGGC